MQRLEKHAITPVPACRGSREAFASDQAVRARSSARGTLGLAVSALGFGLVALFPTSAFADNPIVQTNYTADPAPMVHEGRLYLYTSHDEDVSVNDFYTMNDWRLYSTVDMVNWTDHGSPASYKTFSWGTGDAWAPQGIFRDGKFFFYVPLNNATGARIGVGVATKPEGPFMDPLGKQLAAMGSGNIDPTVFIDDDGQAYMYWGNMTLRYVKLNSDMISYSGSITNVSMPGFVEGPWLYKRESLYYMVYAASGSGTEKISYATSDSPTGPWTTRGDIMGSGTTYTNHAGIVDYKGRSYFFYHNSALPGGGDFKRSVCVEEFTYGADGSIPKLTMSAKGPEAVASLDPFQQVEAETIAFSSGLKTEVCTDTGAGMNVSSISNGDYIKVKDVDFQDGVVSFEARVSSSSNDAKIELRLDSETGTLLGTCDVSGASSWETKTCAVTGASGKHDLFLKFTGGGGDLFKFNWWKFTGSSMPPDGGSGGAGGAGGGASKAGSGGLDSTQTGGRAGAGGVPAAGGTPSTTGGVSTTGGSTPASGGSSVGAGGSAATNGGRAGSPGASSGGVSTGGMGAGNAAGNPPGSAGSAAVGGANPGPATGGQLGSAGAGSGSSSCAFGMSGGKLGLSATLWLAAVALLRRRAPRARDLGAPPL